ncbi:MAG: MoaD/ThiS family protein [Candidatus Thorarchaeota archaeon]
MRRMKVRIRFRGPLASQMSIDRVELEAPEASTLQQALDLALNTIPPMKEVWDDSNQIDREALLLKNEVDVGLLDGLSTILEAGDEIVILPLVHGG